VANSITAIEFIRRLEVQGSPEKRASYERSLRSSDDDRFVGVRMGDVFALAKEFIGLPLAEVERLLESPIHEARAGALSIMDKQARRKRTTDERREELFRLYLRRMDRIDNWDLVDLGAPQVVGRYLADRERDVLYELTRSENPWERRTAIVATLYFVRQGDVADTFAIAAMLARDDHALVQKPVGGALREAGKVDREALLRFLDQHAGQMARPAVRNAIEQLEPEQRKRYLERVGRRRDGVDA
jgi:3-methyladenine DNA glycosylase AlkD